MKQLRMPLRIVFYREGKNWIAHCLELDLVGHGQTKDEANHLLANAIGTQIEAGIKYGSLDNLFSPADKEYFAMFAAGKDVTIGTLELRQHIDPVAIGEVEAREQADSELSLA
jgi:hypothetical protein